MSTESESAKKVLVLTKKLEQLTDEKITLEIELETLRSELKSWKERYSTLSENVLRMGKNPEQLTAIPETNPKPKSRNSSISPEDLPKISIGEAVKIAVERDLIKKKGTERIGSYQSDSE